MWITTDVASQGSASRFGKPTTRQHGADRAAEDVDQRRVERLVAARADERVPRGVEQGAEQ